MTLAALTTIEPSPFHPGEQEVQARAGVREGWRSAFPRVENF